MRFIADYGKYGCIPGLRRKRRKEKSDRWWRWCADPNQVLGEAAAMHNIRAKNFVFEVKRQI
jgi:hypothetical protein